jgi:hypothetical protein
MHCLCVQVSLIRLKTSHCIKHIESTREHFNCLISLAEYSAGCYNERCCNKGMLQRTVFINKIRMLQRTMLQQRNATTNSFINKIRMLQWTRRNTIGRRSKRVRMKCRAFPHWLESQSSSLLSFVRFSCQFSSVDDSLPSTSTRLFMLFSNESLFIVSTKERLFMLFRFPCTVYRI